MENLKAYLNKRGVIGAIWCIDSETGEECLVDIYEYKVVAKWINGKIVEFYETEKQP